MTNAMPVLDGKLRNSSIAASNPPAEPPMPTIGQLEYCLADCNADFVLDEFNRRRSLITNVNEKNSEAGTTPKNIASAGRTPGRGGDINAYEAAGADLL